MRYSFGLGSRVESGIIRNSSLPVLYPTHLSPMLLVAYIAGRK